MLNLLNWVNRGLCITWWCTVTMCIFIYTSYKRKFKEQQINRVTLFAWVAIVYLWVVSVRRLIAAGQCNIPFSLQWMEIRFSESSHIYPVSWRLCLGPVVFCRILICSYFSLSKWPLKLFIFSHVPIWVQWTQHIGHCSDAIGPHLCRKNMIGPVALH